MAIILRLICEKLSSIAVKISFLWRCEHCLYPEAPFAASDTSRYLRNDMQNFTSVILYMNIIYISLSNYLVLILKFYTIPVRLQDVTNFLINETLQSKHVPIF